ncbi:heterokaryon incompatibility protein-domain-containing protein [Biscogniauxia mediterranea]|nr:heterokaryon incompatibility protein-domain-containing protein [Biscogniauxia mediterranea]
MEDLSIQLPQLCETCEDAGLLILFSRKNTLVMPNKHSTIRLRSINDARRNLHCPLCAFLVDLAEEKWDEVVKGPGEDGVFRMTDVHSGMFFSTSILDPNNEHGMQSIHLCTLCIGAGSTIDKTTKLLRHHLRPVVDYDRAKQWIAECPDQHPHPPVPPQTEKVLQGLINEDPGLKLLDLKTLEFRTVRSSPVPRYVALSYVWGNPKEHTYNPSKVDPISSSRCCFDSLSRTLRESITLARDLGFPYIWIDQLCIDQDDSSPAKKRTIEAMGAIYAAADLVLVAAAGEDASTGLPGTRENPRPETPVCRASTADGYRVEIVRSELDLDDKVQATKWLTRGWTYQEWAFARRSLLVLKDEMFFVCPSATLQREAYSWHVLPSARELENGDFHREFTPLSLSGSHHWHMRDILSNSGSLRSYVNNVDAYTARALSFDKDRLRAFQGILAEIRDGQEKITSGTGLPMRHFGPALTWDAPYDKHYDTLDLQPDVAPSWSWAAVARIPVRFAVLPEPDISAASDFGFQYRPLPPNCVEGTAHSAYLKAYNVKGDAASRDDMGRRPRCLDHEAPETPPVLHLKTVVFAAALKYAAGSGTVPFRFESAPWLYNRALVATDAPQGPPETVVGLFAMVWVARELGETCHYALLLRKVRDHYVRAGLANFKNDDLARLFQDEVANPRWEYVELR